MNIQKKIVKSLHFTVEICDVGDYILSISSSVANFIGCSNRSFSVLLFTSLHCSHKTETSGEMKNKIEDKRRPTQTV